MKGCLVHALSLDQLGIPLTLFLIDLLLYVQIDGDNYEVGNDVHGPDTQKDLRILERNFFRYLHHTKYDHQVRAIVNLSTRLQRQNSAKRIII